MNQRTRSPSQVVAEARVVAGSGGGPDKTILNTPRFLVDTPYPSLCVYLRPPNDPGFDAIREKAQAWKAPLLEVDDRGPLDWRIPVELLNLCRRHRVSIWHGHDYKTNALGLLLNRFWRMRLVTTVHGWVHHTRRTPLYYRIDRLCLPRYERVICVSEDLRQRCLEWGVPPERCVLIENGIDTEEFRRRQPVGAARAALGISPGRLVIGAVGRLSAEKGFDVLIEAVARLARDGLDVELRIVGEGDEKSRLQGLLAASGLGERGRLMGYLPDTRTFYEALDVYALSSHREGLPNVLLEAMALGVPVVATRVAGVPRLVQDGVSGLLVAAGDGVALAGALAELLRDPARRDALGRAGRVTIESEYSFAVRMEKVRAVYDQLVAE
jgi:glycosyltransferase involved in cell wall biosynthesis